MTSPEIERRAAEEGFDQGFYGIPDSRKRAGMSPEKLAIKLSTLEKGSPPYILIEHELNVRLAKEQAKATLSAGWLGAGATVMAVFIAAALGYLAGTSQPKESNNGPREKTGAVSSASSPSPKAIEVPPVGGSAQTSKEKRNEKP